MIMDAALTFGAIAALFGTMMVLAFIPGASVVFKNSCASRVINITAGSVMPGIGVLLIARA